MAILGVGSGTGFPGAIDTAQTFANIGSPDPDDNTRVDAELVNDVLAAVLAIENNCARLGVANTFTANQTISNTAPSLVLTDTTGSAKSLTVAVDANLAQLRESAGASGSLVTLDLVNNRTGYGTATPARMVDINGMLLASQIVGQPNGIFGQNLYYSGGWKFVTATGYGFNFKIDGSGVVSLEMSTNSSSGIDSAATTIVPIQLNGSGQVGVGMTPTQQFELSGSVGQKASGTTWSNPSDARLKENIKDYADGLDVILKMRPVSYELNGLAGTPKGQRGISVIAQEQLKAMPYTIETYKAKLHPEDEQETELYRFEASAVTFALVNAVKELAAQVAELRARIQ